MSIVHVLDGCGWTTQEVRGPDGTVVQRDLLIIHQQSDQVWRVPLGADAAAQIGEALIGREARLVVAPVGMQVPRNGHEGHG